MTINHNDQARRCPKCDEYGAEIRSIPSTSPRTGFPITIVIVQCQNDRCVWGKDRKNWLFQVNPDGNVVAPRKPGPKQFVVDTSRQRVAEEQIESLQAMRQQRGFGTPEVNK